MPASLEAAVVFAVLIVPGQLLIRGYNRARAHAQPSRDLFALAQAVIVSLAWLPVIWVAGGHQVLDWLQRGAAQDHELEVLAIVLLNLVLALLGGLGAGRVVDEFGSREDSRLARFLAWTGIFEPPSAWDAAWLVAEQAEWAAVEIRLKNGDTFNVLFDEDSVVGLSPAPRQLYFDTEYRWENDEPEFQSTEGIFIDGSEVASVRFEHFEPPAAE